MTSCRAWRWCWWARIRPARSMSATRPSRPVEVGMASFEHKLSRETGQAELLALVEQPQRRSEGERHPGPASLAEADRSPGGARRHRSGQGCRRLPCGQCRQARHRRQGPGALHAAGLPDAAEGSPGRSLRQAGHRGRAAPTSSASPWPSCCWARAAPSPSPIRAPAICRANAAGPRSWSPPSASRRWCAAIGSQPGATVIDVGINRIERDGKTEAGGRCRL